MSRENCETGETAKLPAIYDEWSDEESGGGTIQGTLLKCIDGVWTLAQEGTPVPENTRLLVLGTIVTIVRWKDKKPAEELVWQPGNPLPNVDELNAKISQSEWEFGPDGEPRPPYVKTYVVHFISPATAERFTFKNSTAGAARAVWEVADKVKWMRLMRGANVVPLVKLANRPMTTRFGKKIRPHFEIIEWLEPGGGSPQLEHKTHGNGGGSSGNAYAEVKSGMRIVEPVTTSEELDDEIPF